MSSPSCVSHCPLLPSSLREGPDYAASLENGGRQVQGWGVGWGLAADTGSWSLYQEALVGLVQLQIQSFAEGILVAGHFCSQEAASAATTCLLVPSILGAWAGLKSFISQHWLECHQR